MKSKKKATFDSGNCRDYECAQKLYVMDSTTISQISNVLKDTGRNPKIGRKNGGIKSHTIMKPLTGVTEFITFDRAYIVESLYKELKQNFPLRFFYGESTNAIETQIWVVMIANLLVKQVKAQVKRVWCFSNIVSLLRNSLDYYYDFVPFLENPERVAANSFVGGCSPPGQPQLNLV